MKFNIPQLLIMVRFIMAPLMLISAWNYQSRATWFIITLLYLGFISDIFDGIIARHRGESSQKLRRMDSQVDMVFWLSAGFSLWFIAPDIISENKAGILMIFLMEASCYAVSLLKFGKETCTHAWLSKFWGITLLLAFTAMLGF
ncbi:MAG: CDP-alcohol phosphatidyltransferase family protein, partial [Owenweeksia sp.]